MRQIQRALFAFALATFAASCVTLVSHEPLPQMQNTTVSGGIRWNGKIQPMKGAIAYTLPLLTGEEFLEIECYPYALTRADMISKAANHSLSISTAGRLSDVSRPAVAWASLNIEFRGGTPSECILSWHVISADGKGVGYSQFLSPEKQLKVRTIDLRQGGIVDLSAHLDEIELFTMDAEGKKVVLGTVGCDMTINGYIFDKRGKTKGAQK